MTTYREKRELINRILNNEIDYSEIDFIIEWFIEEPEWEDMYWFQFVRKGSVYN